MDASNESPAVTADGSHAPTGAIQSEVFRVSKLTIFSHGIANFELTCRVDGNADIRLPPFRQSEMNDVLKSLTVADSGANEGRGLVTSITYPSSTDFDASEDLSTRLQVDPLNPLLGLIVASQGAEACITLLTPMRICETAASTVTGVILGNQTVHISASEGRTSVCLLLQDGNIVSIPLLDVGAIRFVDPQLQRDLAGITRAALGARQRNLKTVTVSVEGVGEREIIANYAVAAPTWKTSYRILVSPESSTEAKKNTTCTVQGWAIVDNVSEKDLDNVSLSLVSGLPISFEYDLYSKQRVARPTERITTGTKPAYNATSTAVFGTAAKGTFGDPAAAFPASLSRSRDPPGAGGASRRMKKREAAFGGGGPDLAASAVGGFGESSEEEDEFQFGSGGGPTRVAFGQKPDTDTSDVGDLVHHSVRAPVSIRARESALVPIVLQECEGGRTSIYNERTRSENPLSAVRLRNDTGVSWEKGPCTFFEGSNIIGEAMLPLCRSGEEKFLPFAVDLACKAEVTRSSSRGKVKEQKLVRGVLHLKRYAIQTTDYKFTSSHADKDLEIYVQHYRKHDHNLDSASVVTDTSTEANLVDKSRTSARYKIEVPRHGTATLQVKETMVEKEEFHLTNQIHTEYLVANGFVSGFFEKEMGSIIEVQGRLFETTSAISAEDMALSTKVNEQQRYRENIAATPEDSALRRRYLQLLDDSETDIEERAKKLSKLRAQEEAIRAELTKLIENANAIGA